MKLRPYQEVGRDFLAARTRALLADEMRVGKTPQAILAAAKIQAQRSLVLCPAIAIEHWRREWLKWDGPGDVDILSYDAARTLWKGGKLRGLRWDAMIPDEAHFAKNPDAARTKMVYGTTGLGWQADRIWALTGTPAPNHAGELWPMLRAFGAVGMDYDRFVRYFCVYNEYLGRITGNRPEHLDELRSVLKRFTLRRTRAEVAPDMPEIDYQFLEVAPRGIDLRSSDPDLVDREDRIDVACAKAPQLAEEIEWHLLAGEYEQTVVFGYHREPLDRLERELRQRGVMAVEQLNGDTSHPQRTRIQDRFAVGITRVILAQIIAAGTAIDLSAARHGYFLELDYVPGNNEQAANRLVSMDKMDRVSIDIVTWPGTRDDTVQRGLIRKVQDAVFKKETR